jgi:hypothetical protein
MSSRTYVKRTFVRETMWTCSSCGHKNLGRHTDCQQCSSPKEKDEKYVSQGRGAPEATAPEVLELAKTGPNRCCPYCGADVRDTKEACPSCGATRNEHKEEAGPEPEEPEDLPRRGLSMAASPPPKPPVPNKHTRLLPGLAVGLVVLMGVAGIVWLCLYLFLPWETDAQVTGVRWTYHVDLQQKTLRHEEDWEGEMHVGAFNTSCMTRQRGTENCNPHQCDCRDESYQCNCRSCNCSESCRESCTDNGNGTESCSESCTQTCDECCDTCTREVCRTCYDQCPVYDDWCSYDWYDWPVVNHATTSGADLNVYAPALQARGSDQRLIETTRFDVRFTADEDEWSYRPSNVADFRRFSPARWRIKVNRAGQVQPLRRLAGGTGT